MARPKTYSWPAPDDNGICLAQTTAGAGALAINGALLDAPATMQGVSRVVLPGIQRVVSITSGADVSGVDFTITGTDLRGAAVTETIAGPVATTVETTAEFHTITSVTVDGALGDAASVGTGTTGMTTWFIFDYWVTPFSVSLQASVTDTINYTVNTTNDDVESDTTPAVTAVSGMAGATGDTADDLVAPWRAVQATVNSSTDGALSLFILQAG